MQASDNKKCYSCGKLFRTPANLLAHKRRKTPCLIRDVKPQDQYNPLRCIFCNKILSKKENLTRHLQTCKIKNGGMDVLDEKILYERRIRALESRDQQKDKLIGNQIAIIAQMQSQIDTMQQTIIQCATINNTTINNTTHQNITINFYNYDAPRVDTLHMTQDDLLTESVLRKVIELIYFNKLIPENHVLYRPNIKEQRLLVHRDGAWQTVVGEECARVFYGVKNVAYFTGGDKVNGGDIYHTDADFRELYPAVQEAIRRFNLGERITDDALMDIITAGRNVVKNTLRQGKVV